MSCVRVMWLVCGLVVVGLGVGAGCPGAGPNDGDPSTQNLPSLNGVHRLELPPSAPAADTLKVVCAMGEAAVYGDATFDLATAGGGPQLAALMDANGTPMMLGWLDETRHVLSTRTTAEVLAYFGMHCDSLGDDAQLQMIVALAAEPEVTPLADALTSALTGNSAGLMQAGDGLRSAARQVLAALEAKYADKTARSQKLLIDPSARQSGVDVLHAPAINTIEIVNNFRRRGQVTIQRQSYTLEGGGTVTGGAPAEALAMSPTKGVGEGVFDTAGDIFKGLYGVGTMAYEPVSLGYFELPVPAGATQAEYRIAVLGAGANAGQTAELSDDERLKMYLVWAQTLGQDLLLPAVTNVVLPIKNYGNIAFKGTWVEMVAQPDRAALSEDFISAVKDTPGAMDAMARGDTAGALNLLWTHLAYDNSLIRSATSKLVLGIVGGLEEAGKLPAGSMDEALSGLSHAAKIFNALSVVDMLFGAGDLGVVLTHIGMSNQADIWTVTALKPTVLLQPAESKIEPYGHVSLEVVVPELTGFTAGAVNLEYHWRCTASVGSIIDGKGHTGTDFTGTSPYISYFADQGKPGIDTITVTVTELQVGGHATLREEIGTTTATITVKGRIVTLAPNGTSLDPSQTVRLDAIVQPPPEPGETLEYEWSCTNSMGALVSGAGLHDTFSTFKADFPGGGHDDVTVKLFKWIEGERRLLDTHAVGVDIALPRVQLAPPASTLAFGESVALSVQLTPQPAAADGIVRYVWSNTASVGTLTDGVAGHVDSFTSDLHAATYKAGTTTIGADTVRAEVWIEAHGQNKLVGMAEASLQVGQFAVTLQAFWPNDQRAVFPGVRKKFTAVVTPAPDASDVLVYRWKLGAGQGRLTDSAGHLNDYESSEQVAWHEAPKIPGFETVQVTAYRVVGGVHQEIGTAAETFEVKMATVTLLGWSGSGIDGTLHYLPDGLEPLRLYACRVNLSPALGGSDVASLVFDVTVAGSLAQIFGTDPNVPLLHYTVADGGSSDFSLYVPWSAPSTSDSVHLEAHATLQSSGEDIIVGITAVPLAITGDNVRIPPTEVKLPPAPGSGASWEAYIKFEYTAPAGATHYSFCLYQPHTAWPYRGTNIYQRAVPADRKVGILIHMGSNFSVPWNWSEAQYIALLMERMTNGGSHADLQLSYVFYTLPP